METKVVFDKFVEEMQSAFPDTAFAISNDIDQTVSDIESQFFPHVMKIIKRDDSFFAEPRMILGINVSQLWSQADTDSTKETIWKNVLLCMTASLLHGDIKSKFSKILDIIKSVWNGSGQTNDEVSRILNDENSEGRLKELFDFVMETRIVKIFFEIVESFEMDEEVTDPQKLMEILQNPEHPIIQKIITKIKNLLAEKARRGSFTQEQLQREIEAIKAKITSIFGNMILGGRGATVPSTVLLGNSPEARRQRILARLQKKVRDKK